jgi:hypothetical protein
MSEQQKVEALKAFLSAAINAYHTTRLSDVPAVDHILSKPRVQSALAEYLALLSVPQEGMVPDELRKLSEAATAGEWRVHDQIFNAIMAQAEIGLTKRALDAAFIVATVNHVRAMISSTGGK